MIILDFDGTLTNAEEEGIPFTEGCLQDLADLTDWPIERVRERAVQVQNQMLANPTAHAWEYDGYKVAPATVDPYLRIKPIATVILAEAGVTKVSLEQLYLHNYPKSNICFRPQTLELMLQLCLTGCDAHIVTNSATEPVRGKIQKLGEEISEQYSSQKGHQFVDWWWPRVHGGAKKYVVEEPEQEWEQQVFRLPGLDRPVLCHRPRYHDLLKRLVQNRVLSWDQVLVVGDVFELDLALPLALGARVGLMVGDSTPPYETAFLAHHPKAKVLRDLHEILPYYRGTRSAV